MIRADLALWTLIFLPVVVQAADIESVPASIHAAIEKSLPLLQEGAKTFRERSEGRCIACHHQGLVLQTVSLARRRGFRIVEELARAEKERVHGFYARRHNLYNQALTDPDAAKRADSYGNFTVHVGYWLWGLAAENVAPDQITATASRLLATKQYADGHWSFDDLARAPMQASDFTTTALAVFVLKHYGPTEDNPNFRLRIQRASEWMLKNSPRTTDDKVFRLFGLSWSEAPEEELQQAANTLRAEQRTDGGWAQQENMPSDAYATGLALVALQQTGRLASTDSAYQSGTTYLLNTQQKDGSWFVKSRAIPSNPYFESGFPHGKSQFISYAASCWATKALLLTVAPK